MSSDITPDKPEYRQWLGELKARFRQVQLKAAVAVNTRLLQFYRELGADIVARQTGARWGEGFLKQLSADLMHEFPEVKGFSLRSLKYIRQWYMFYAGQKPIGQQAVAQFAKQPVSQFPARRKTMAIGAQLHRMKPIFGRLERVLGLDDSAEAGGTWV